MTNITRLVRDTRPQPPDLAFGSFVPAPELEAWARRTFIDEGGVLVNEEHAHLRSARLGFVWTNIGAARQGRTLLGQCELMPPMAMGKWQRERALFQVAEWFGAVPDFMITVFAPWWAEMDDASACAVIEHELCHAGQARDEFGQPKFKRNGFPEFAIRGHDVEEFVSVVGRYGHRAAGVTDMVEAANRGPSIGEASIAMACGTCQRRRA